MIARISGKLVEKKEHSLIVNVAGMFYEVIVPAPVLARIEDTIDDAGNVNLVTYYYFQIGPSSGIPIIIGFINEIEKEFFQQFIKVSGIGPRAAVKALSKPISEITTAIEAGDVKYLKTLSGIGLQKAKEIVAKLQGKIGRYGLIQDKEQVSKKGEAAPDWQDEALSVLIKLQYKNQEALDMISKAVERNENISTTEELLNEIYRQRVKN
ncbi:MAG: Holliday junction DNA helicase RuvA [Candidatus Omnitrophica bacterium]|nr:Holliday junction DNA helicase RuvA [Candidatus Omnitrophota bacterium]MBU1996522.1 Holliday junction DNA helicase RuvA [Candidatus Omnitrophota bacterium]MBU4333165.1 Holliday junction DNA helicase RuvA [Candidatus Omnitrophota bacterium]